MTPAASASPFDARPIIVAIAGPNGAGKSTFYAAFIAPAALRFVNADDLAREHGLGPEQAASMATNLREELVAQRESFVFETVFSDPVGDKVGFLERAASAGYQVMLCFIGIDGTETSEQRVNMRVVQGGHDVPRDRLVGRYPRTLENLARPIGVLPHVRVYDNSDLSHPFRLVAEFASGALVAEHPPCPAWLPRAR